MSESPADRENVIVVRPATEADEPALQRIDGATWSPRVTPGPRPDPDSPFFEAGRAPADVLVAQDGGQVVGYLSLHQFIPLPSHAHVLEINGLAVDPLHQGRGVGRRLVEAGVELARTRGARKVTLRVLAPNQAALALYGSCGFVVEGVLRREFVLDGVAVDDHLMARLLD